MNPNPFYGSKNHILQSLANLKDFLASQPNNKNLLKNIDEITQYVMQQKFGLVFESHEEEWDEIGSSSENSSQMVASLKESPHLSICKGEPEHILIEGENLVVLRLLLPTYKDRIDVICIDPPYNTGDTALKYNDTDYSDARDAFSHSKWLSFMDKRLRLAKDLLTPSGVMFINIDETQIGCLILLCQQIFEEKNVVVLVWPKTDPKYDQNRVQKSFSNVMIVHEYVVLCYKDKRMTHFNKMRRRPKHCDFSAEEQEFDLDTILDEVGTTSSSKDELCEIFGNRDSFSTPKPRKMIKEFVRVAAGPNAVILDFFAGSGTTGHAVMDLNKEDGGARKFILVTNNESDICKNVTYERLKRVIDIDDYQESLRYYKLELVSE